MRKRQTARSANTAEPSQTRREIAAEAARIMADEGVRDFHAAKKKAAARLNIKHTKDLPNNQEIDAALAERLQLFHRDLPDSVAKLRRIAVDAMYLFADFRPRLVGAVLSGHITPFTPIELHITADRPEDVVFFLEDNMIPFDQGEKRLRFGGERYISVPHFRVFLEAEVELSILTPERARETPLSTVDGNPVKRASVKDLENLISGT